MEVIIDFDNEILIDEPTSNLKTIFTVPISMYHGNPHIYEPKFVKIGAMQESKYNTIVEKYKLTIVKKIIKNYFNNNTDEFLSNDSEKIVNMYDCHPNFYKTNTKWAIAIDATFVAWFITGDREFKFIEDNNITIMLDLILMKNQIPLILIKNLLDKIHGPNIKELLNDIFKALSPFGYSKISNTYLDNPHLLGCFYTSMVAETTPQKGTQCPKLFRASKLRSYGIEFKAIKDLRPDRPTFASITFDKRNKTLTLPRITMYHERTEVILKNLIAYELVYSPVKTVREYVLFMDYLVDTVEDLQILIDAEIIENKMGSDENAVELWNTICMGTTTEFGPKLAEIINDTHKHCSKLKHRLVKESYDKFFSRPWLIVSLITAIIITAATIIQTVYSVMSYYPH